MEWADLEFPVTKLAPDMTPVISGSARAAQPLTAVMPREY
jgi:hypothetical protein